VCLTVPVVRPSQYGTTHSDHQQAEARDLRQGTSATQTMADHGG
jgi:hypothetical protein